VVPGPTRSAEKDFEELLSLLWAARLAQLRFLETTSELPVQSPPPDARPVRDEARIGIGDNCRD